MHLAIREEGGQGWREGKEVKIFGEKAVNTIHIKGKEVSGAHGYKDHCQIKKKNP